MLVTFLQVTALYPESPAVGDEFRASFKTRARVLSNWRQREQLHSWCSGEHTVMAHEWDAEPEGGGRNPPIAIMDLVAEGVPGPNTAVAKHRAHRRHLVVGLDEREPRQVAFQPGAGGLERRPCSRPTREPGHSPGGQH
jgi:hypothetical protein